MAIHLIIDGYNMIGQTEGLGNDLEDRRRRLIERLSHYRRARGHKVSIVFDGTKGGGFMEETFRTAGVNVLFSRAGETADDLLRQMAGREGSGCVVVSSDRAVQAAARTHGAVAIGIKEFESRLRVAAEPTPILEKDGAEDDDAAPAPKKGNPRRLSKAERRKQERLRRM